MCELLTSAVNIIYNMDETSESKIDILILPLAVVIFSSPVVCLCHGFMSVVDRAP